MPKPNLLFIFSDQQHWEAAGFVDASFQTPHLNRLAAEGIRFSHAFCTTPQCSPSRSSILTGQYPHKTGVWGNMEATGGDALNQPSLAPALQAAGYHTAYFGKWHLGKEPAALTGWDEDFGVTGAETIDDAAVTQRALAFLARAGNLDKPFALFLSYNNPHDVYHIDREQNLTPRTAHPLPASWQGHDFSSVPDPQREFMAEDQGLVLHGKDEAAWQRYRELYREKTRLYDAELGRVLEALDRHGLAGQTLTVATSDHGDMDGQHRLIFKGPFMYEHLIRVPLVVRLPAAERGSLPAGRTETFPSVNVDLAPTLADFAGANLPASDGVSLRPLLTGRGQPPSRDFVIAQYFSKQKWVNPIRMIRTARHKYVLYAVHGEELYDLEADPDELHNLAADPAQAATKSALRAQLEQWMRDNGDPFATLEPSTRSGERLPASA